MMGWRFVPVSFPMCSSTKHLRCYEVAEDILWSWRSLFLDFAEHAGVHFTQKSAKCKPNKQTCELEIK